MAESSRPKSSNKSERNSRSSSRSSSPSRLDLNSIPSSKGWSTISSNASSADSIINSMSGSSGKPFSTMRIIPIKALSDNYMYLLIDEKTRKAACVDPVNASAIESYVEENKVDLKLCLTTHHHHDHAGGNADLRRIYPDVEIYGGDKRIPSLTKLVSWGEELKLGNLTIQCLTTPGHTKGHICYYVTGPANDSTHTSPSDRSDQVDRAVFTGDTLFVGGCGRFFEGSPEDMYKSLSIVLGGLPDETRVYCGHEYTVTNLKFALTVEPHNTHIKAKLAWAQKKVSEKEPTVPSTIQEERMTNPFMRTSRESVRIFTKENHDFEVMAVLRQLKNEFIP